MADEHTQKTYQTDGDVTKEDTQNTSQTNADVTEKDSQNIPKKNEGLAEDGTIQIGEDNKRNCWVCFATDEDDTSVAWVQPCNCRGTTKWVC
jgi:E3 ubiquitin-protein ligase MARCH5